MSITSGIKVLASTIGRGFLLGVGFGIAIGACVVFGAPLIKANIDETFREMDRSYRARPADIQLSEVSEQRTDTSHVIVGRASNIGTKPARRVQVQVNFFSSGAFVDQCEGYLSGALEPGAESYFKISCACSKDCPHEHDSLKAVVIVDDWA